MKIKLTTLLLFFISSTLFAQKGWETLTKDNYAVSYPKDWISSEQKPQPSMVFLLMSDEKSQNEDKFRENINLTLEDLTLQTLSLEDYSKLSIDQITGQIPSAKVISNESIKIDGWEAIAVIWTADFGNGMALKFKQIFLINNGKAYILTFSSTTTEYDEYIEVGDKILNSFKLAK
ncbi:PsbP-related protein [Winogradskyella sp. UBA3174]|uniref:PsbP-related protein n=1 Tax=Winogradskyella sp. UBA3174 TaxID=1947785 RepID=UPI0025FE437E|nr:PsbP-related protein [Winogradskyella sp. UBA3174]|tara:strand:- start:32686 stop:33213 length:528 start_codon:yes stop_codon:yes gene_type:complete